MSLSGVPEITILLLKEGANETWFTWRPLVRTEDPNSR
jgi:hypothetical protein